MTTKTCNCGKPAIPGTSRCAEHQPAARQRRLVGGRWKTQRARRDTFNRDGYTCRAVGCNHHDPSGRTLEAHHIRPVSEGGTAALWNMLTLCVDHHRQLEAKREQARRQARAQPR